MSKNAKKNLSRRDLLARAIERERDSKRQVTMEQFTSFGHAFKCELCGKWRPDELRREPRSEICLSCVEDAGFKDDTI